MLRKLKKRKLKNENYLVGQTTGGFLELAKALVQQARARAREVADRFRGADPVSLTGSLVPKKGQSFRDYERGISAQPTGRRSSEEWDLRDRTQRMRLLRAQSPISSHMKQLRLRNLYPEQHRQNPWRR